MAPLGPIRGLFGFAVLPDRRLVPSLCEFAGLGTVDVLWDFGRGSLRGRGQSLGLDSGVGLCQLGRGRRLSDHSGGWGRVGDWDRNWEETCCIGHHPLHPVGKAPGHSHTTGADQDCEGGSQDPETKGATTPGRSARSCYSDRTPDVALRCPFVDLRCQKVPECGEVVRHRVSGCLLCHGTRPTRD